MKWISVKDQMPEESGQYIVCTKKKGVYCTWFYTNEGSFGAKGATHITHWMPLPNPPKGVV